MVAARTVRAVLFDMDGTLIDSERYTDEAVSAVVGKYGVRDFLLPTTETRGRTWLYVANAILERLPIRATAEDLAQGMLEFWTSATVDVQPIPGAIDAIRRAAAERLRLGVVSSSPRFLIDSCLEQLGVNDLVPVHSRVGGDAVSRTKPDPEGYLRAAKSLDVPPADVFVFEDSRAGLMAAQAAGMRSMFVTCCAVDVEENAKLAMASCHHYERLPATFWADLAAGRSPLAGQSFP